MDVSEFVKEALLAIVRGIKAAQAEPDSANMIGRLPSSLPAGVSVQFDEDKNLVGFVEFDLATTVDKTAGGKAGVAILGSGIGAEGKVQSSFANRIKFAVPLGIAAPSSQKKQLQDDEKRRSDSFNRDLIGRR